MTGDRWVIDLDGTDATRKTWASWHPGAGSVEVYRLRDMTAIMAREPCGGLASSPMRWHISVAGTQDVPSWREMVACAHQLRPGVVFVIGVPPRSWWMNCHPHTLHLWQTGDLPLIQEFQANARNDEPT